MAERQNHLLGASLALALAWMVSLVLAPAAQAENRALTAQEIRDLIVGNTAAGPIGTRMYDFSNDPDGRLYGSIGVSSDSGTWTVSDDGVHCHE